MLSEFSVYLELGFLHITDIQGYDHILYIIALVLSYGWNDIKKVIWLVTAFTLGHSLTLALSVIEVVDIPADLIETLIPVTIIFTALVNIVSPKKKASPYGGKKKKENIYGRYFLATFFGLIHGLGFSNYLKVILIEGDQILLPLFAFNVGLEIGQILIVLLFLVFKEIIFKLFRINHYKFNVLISCLIILASIHILFF